MLRSILHIFIKPFRNICRKIAQSLKYKMILFFIMISVVPIFLIGILIYQSTSQIFVDRVTKSSTDLIMKKISYFDEVFDEINKIISEGTSSTDTIKLLNLNKDNIDLSESNQVLDRVSSKYEYILSLKGNFIDSIMILPRKGSYPFYRGLKVLNYVEDFSKLDIYKKTVDSKRLVLWSIEKDPVSGKYYIVASSSIFDALTDKVIGVFLVYLDINKLREIFGQEAENDGMELSIIDSDNTIMYDFNSRIGQQYSNTEVLQKMGSSPEGSFKQNIDGYPCLVTYYTSVNSGWRIVNIVSYNSILSDVNVILTITIIISLGCLLYAFIIAVLFYRGMYNPIKRLMFSMHELGEGNWDIRISSQRKDELGKLSDGFDSMIVRISTLIENIRIEQRLKKENEIRALQSQITPHFLYNTLNCIKALVMAGRKEDSAYMITSLIALLKISLSSTNENVTIHEELNYVKCYIDIMKFRYEKEVEVVYDIDSRLLCSGILKFVLQPIVENCFIHAFTDMQKDWKIIISIAEKEEGILVKVIDNGVGINLDDNNPLERLELFKNNSRVKFSSIGINNINERIHLNYGEQYGIRIESEPGKGSEIQLLLPRIDIML